MLHCFLSTSLSNLQTPGTTTPPLHHIGNIAEDADSGRQLEVLGAGVFKPGGTTVPSNGLHPPQHRQPNETAPWPTITSPSQPHLMSLYLCAESLNAI
jgi:hypothetical protein